MNISEKMTQQQLQEILIDVMLKGEREDVEVKEMVEDIIRQVLRAMNAGAHYRFGVMQD